MTRVRDRFVVVAAWVPFGLTCVWLGSMLFGGEPEVVISGVAPGGSFAQVAVFTAAFTGLGGLVLAREPRNRAGWLCLVPVLIPVSSFVGSGFASPDPSEAWSIVSPSAWLVLPAIAVPMSLLLFVLPNGHLPTPSWSPIAVTVGGAIALLTGMGAFQESVEVWARVSSTNPYPGLGFENSWTAVVALAEFIVRAGTWMGLLCLMHRVVLSRGRARVQVAWLMLGAFVMEFTVGFPGVRIGSTLAGGDPAAPWPLEMAGVIGALALPATAVVAILRFRLVDLDPLLRRLLLTAVLVAVLTVLYLLLRAWLGTDPFPATVTAVGMALLTPALYRWLNGGVSRLMYGRKGSPAEIASTLRRRLAAVGGRPEEVMGVLADAVVDCVPSAVEVVLEDAGHELARVSRGVTGDSDRWQELPLTFGSSQLGHVRIAPVSALDDADTRALTDLVGSAAAAVAAAHRAAQLGRAHRALITAREQERRHVSRDLHDGIGPVLSGLGFTLDALRPAIHDPLAQRLLGDARTQLREATQLVRHLARELRPLAIDQLGLLGSLRELAAQHSRSSLTVDVTSADLGNLSAATEVVAYAIVAEALTNVARHSQAGHCTITLRREDHCLDVTIRDDGIGTRAARNGIGLTSMDERAGEIGGTWTISSAAGNGTTVHARLPTHTEGPPTTRASAIIEAGAP